MTLAELGWNEFFAQAFAPYAADGRVPGGVTLELKGYYEVTGEAGAKLGQCTGRFVNQARSLAEFPAIGDWVAVTPQSGEETRVHIHALLPRRTKFSRKAARAHELEQVNSPNFAPDFLHTSLMTNYT